MTHPVVQKPILEPVIMRDGSVDYTTSNLVDPLVSFDQVHEYFDEQSKTLRTTLDEIYNSISQLSSNVETFQSTVDKTNDSFTVLQRNVNAQLENIKKQFEQLTNQTNIQLEGFTNRMDGMTSRIDGIQKIIDQNKMDTNDMVDALQKQIKALQTEMVKMVENNKESLEVSNNALDFATHAHEDVEVLRDIVIPKIEQDIQCKDDRLTEAIAAEVERATSAEHNILDTIDKFQKESRSTDDQLKQNISQETLRAIGVESDLSNRLQANADQNTKSIDQLRDSLDELKDSQQSIQTAVTREITDRTAMDTNIQNSLAAEVQRATSTEDALRDEIRSLTGGSSTLSEKLQDEIEDRIQDVNSVRVAYSDADKAVVDGLHEMIVSADTLVRSDLTSNFSQGINQESLERINADDKLGEVISNLSASMSKDFSDIHSELDALKESVSAENTDLIDRVTKLERSVSALEEKVNSTTLDEKINQLDEIVQYIKAKVDQMDGMIEDKVNRQTAMLIDRVERLDNRLDHEIHFARAKEGALSKRISILEGTSEEDLPEETSDDSECDDTCPV